MMVLRVRTVCARPIDDVMTGSALVTIQLPNRMAVTLPGLVPTAEPLNHTWCDPPKNVESLG